ncbi:ATP synthase delta chain [Rhynchospora pubera]|uniref:ATP synthase delta chain n=1 Tax=Rhynchospora pubera TaxID=906938 RepID=A0AAV8E8W2_9POAL|nr:ATP synthase delta chain [Rhynchospora pubera]KAJ4776590.1 ATP synthase delta chain [Rhynchospora pubera]
MDALSTPVAASFKSGGTSLLIPSSPRSSISLLKASSLPLPSTTNSSFHTKPGSLQSKSSVNSLLHPSPVPKTHNFVHTSPSNSVTFHHRAATGYAAALADAACRAGTLAAADVDMRRLVRRVRGVVFDPAVKETEKADMVLRATRSDGYEKHVVALIRLLAKKGKLGLLEEVMTEFSKICYELRGTKLVMVGLSKRRGDGAEFEGVAREMQRTTGASRVKVRHILYV